MSVEATVEEMETPPAMVSAMRFVKWTDAAWALLLLRLWLGLRWFLAGVEKFELDGTYSVANHTENMSRMAEGFASVSFLPLWLTNFYTMFLGYEQLLLGLLLLLGVKLRVLLILTGLMYISLSFGLMVVAEDESIALLGVHLALTAIALLLTRHQKWVVWADRRQVTTES